MVGLTFALLRSQWAQALTVFALAALAVAAAVAAPVYVDMAGHAIAAGDITAAPLPERTIMATDDLQVKAPPGNETAQQLVDDSKRRDFEHIAPPLLRTPGFGIAFAVSYPAFVTSTVDGPGDHNGSLEFREGFCDNVVLVAGRCVAAPGEVIVSEGRGRGRHLGPGRRPVPAGRGRGLPAPGRRRQPRLLGTVHNGHEPGRGRAGADRPTHAAGVRSRD